MQIQVYYITEKEKKKKTPTKKNNPNIPFIVQWRLLPKILFSASKLGFCKRPFQQTSLDKNVFFVMRGSYNKV